MAKGKREGCGREFVCVMEDGERTAPRPASPPRCPPLPREVEEGALEYKLLLQHPIEEGRLQHLITQLNWRLGEGGGVMRYMVGVADWGEPTGVSAAELEGKVANLRAAQFFPTAFACTRKKKKKQEIKDKQ